MSRLRMEPAVGPKGPPWSSCFSKAELASLLIGVPSFAALLKERLRTGCKGQESGTLHDDNIAYPKCTLSVSMLSFGLRHRQAQWGLRSLLEWSQFIWNYARNRTQHVVLKFHRDKPSKGSGALSCRVGIIPATRRCWVIKSCCLQVGDTSEFSLITQTKWVKKAAK